MEAYYANGPPGYAVAPVTEEPILSQDASYETDSGSDSEDEDDSLITIPESIYCDVVITVARGHIPEVVTSLVLTVGCILLQICLAQTMAGQLAGDGAQLFGMVNLSDVPTEISRFDGNSLFDIWSSSSTKGDTCDMGVKKKWWACNEFSWSYEAEAAGDMGSYFTETHGQWQGFLFGGIALFLWMGYQVMELKSIMNYAQLLFLPSGAHPQLASEKTRNACWPKSNALAEGKHYVYNKEEGSGSLKSLSLPAKICVVLVMIARLYICVNLTNFGAKFLCYTSSLKDFILNSVALVFVYDIDELFFTVFLSSRKQRRITTLEPPSVSGVARTLHNWLGGTIGEFIGIILTVLVTYFFAATYLVEYANAYSQAYYNMCGDALDEANPFGTFTCRDESFQPDSVLRGPRPPPGGGIGR